MGMDVIFIPKANAKGLTPATYKKQIKRVNKVEDVYKMLF
jgi:hypothetical protein